MGKKVKEVSVDHVDVLSDLGKLRRTITKVAAVLAFLAFADIIGGFAMIDFALYQYAIFFNGGVLLLLLIIGILSMTKKDDIADILLNLLIGPALFANIWLYLGKEIGIHYFIVVLAVLPFVTINRQFKFFQWLFAVANIAMLTLLLNFETIGSINGLLPPFIFTVFNYSAIGMSLLLIILMFMSYTRMIENYEAELKIKDDELKIMSDEIRKLALEDTSTGAVTHRKLEELIISEIARSDRYDTPFSLIIFSLSDIKEVFAVYGQEKGEKIMEQLVQIVRNDLRLVDVLGRWSDGEFLIFMPEIKLHQAVYVAQRLLKIIAVIDFFPKIKLPSNFAVLQRQPGEKYEILTERLFELIKKSRDEGENQICS
ncbi:MAG: diguanylate cyclase [Erysipelotrichaceae bacterium]|nr:diguanylate cyclase [Erysipelotrichaceae bacterium]